MNAILEFSANKLESITKVLTGPKASLFERYLAVRALSLNLSDSLSPEDCTAQSMADASPIKWHLAHTTWFFETFVLEKNVSDYQHFNPEFRVLFNSYYNSIGEQYLRPHRGLITRPTLDEVYDYRQYIDEQMLKYLQQDTLSDELVMIMEVGLNHEQQHQELMLTDLKHLLSFNPLHPIYKTCREDTVVTSSTMDWIDFTEGVYQIGHDGDGFAFDNEGPRHNVYLENFQLASRMVTNEEYLEFIVAGGYQQPEYWLSDGWAAVKQHAWVAPLYWQQIDGDWFQFTLSGLRKLNLAQPVTHVSYYEADAYARWANVRLPREAEWEVAAASLPNPYQGNFIESGYLHPASVEQEKTNNVLQQMFGDTWEWTQSSYAAYPGFQPAKNELGEYNGKFMCNQYVLRGGSCVTAQSHIRTTYRNFFYPDARWQFSGIRLAKDKG